MKNYCVFVARFADYLLEIEANVQEKRGKCLRKIVNLPKISEKMKILIRNTSFSHQKEFTKKLVT